AKQKKIAPTEFPASVTLKVNNGVSLIARIAYAPGMDDEVSIDFKKPLIWSKGKTEKSLLGKGDGQITISSVGDIFLISDVSQSEEFLFQMQTGEVILNLSSLKGPTSWTCPLGN
ncbi:MAG: hypothetical protein ACAH59_05930, partial [Pseudobdellovibrionaceae bacterium]